MKRGLITISVFLFILAQYIPAQNKFSISAGGGALTSGIDNSTLPYWYNGYLFNLQLEDKVSDQFSLFLSGSFQQHYFQINEVFDYTSNIITGENSTILEFSVGSKYYVCNTRTKPFVGVGIGTLFIKQGRVEERGLDLTGRYLEILHLGSGNNYLLAQINFNMGVEYSLTENLSLVLNTQFISGIFKEPVFFPLTMGVKAGW